MEQDNSESVKYGTKWFKDRIHPTKDDYGKDFVRVYRYFSKENAVKTLASRKLKLGRFSELNDPFEALPRFSNLPKNLPRSEIERFEHNLMSNFNRRFGILSFTGPATIDKPIMWSHYADQHKGIAIGFDIIPDWNGSRFFVPVEYASERPEVSWITDENGYLYPNFGDNKNDVLESLRRLLGRKGQEWEYEEEVRQILPLDNYEPLGFTNGMIFIPMKEDVVSEVILGCRCDLDSREISQILAGSHIYKDTKILHAKRDDSRFMLVCTPDQV